MNIIVTQSRSFHFVRFDLILQIHFIRGLNKFYTNKVH